MVVLDKKRTVAKILSKGRGIRVVRPRMKLDLMVDGR